MGDKHHQYGTVEKNTLRREMKVLQLLLDKNKVLMGAGSFVEQLYEAYRGRGT
jgi:hypothetical protein